MSFAWILRRSQTRSLASFDERLNESSLAIYAPSILDTFLAKFRLRESKQKIHETFRLVLSLFPKQIPGQAASSIRVKGFNSWPSRRQQFPFPKEKSGLADNLRSRRNLCPRQTVSCRKNPPG